MEREYRKTLSILGADHVDHYGRPLTEHLMGTYLLLKNWENPEEVAAAGAFHSIYGTEEFKVRAVSLDRRKEVEKLIGPNAETLVYLFCIADRRALFVMPEGESPTISIPSENGGLLPITSEQYKALLEIEAANIVDQAMHQRGVPKDIIMFWKKAFETKQNYLTTAAASVTRKVLDKALAQYAI